MTEKRDLRKWERSLRAGSWVRVRSKEDILRTLDGDGRLERLPFQPEMFEFCGKRMRIGKVAHKTCDTIKKTGGRRMKRAFHLADSRCNGAFHGGCQADCVFFWKAEWLCPDDGEVSDDSVISQPSCSESIVMDRVKASGHENSDDPVWVCQATKLYEATDLLRWWDISQYVQDVRSGNHSAWKITKLLVAAMYRRAVAVGIGYRAMIGAYNMWQKFFGGQPYPVIEGRIPNGSRTPTEITNLRPGDLVEIKSGEEIAETITKDGFNRGMRYDLEMLKYSGGRYKVQMRVEKLIDEVSGKMLTMKNPCIQLEDVYCRAECTPLRIGCPRASNTYWREIWLRRVD